MSKRSKPTEVGVDGALAIGRRRLILSDEEPEDGKDAVISKAALASPRAVPVKVPKLASLISFHLTSRSIKTSLHADNGLSIPQLLHQIGNATEVSRLEKQEALQQLVKVSLDNDISIWAKYFNQILTAVLEVLDDTHSSYKGAHSLFSC